MILKVLKSIVAMVLLVGFVMATCKNNSFLTYRQVRTSFVGGKVNTFVQKMSDKNGVYLMENDNKTIYFMLSRLANSNKKYITDVVVKPVGDSLTISYKESDRNSIKGKPFNTKLLYRIKLHKAFKKIKVFRNGKPEKYENVYL